MAVIILLQALIRLFTADNFHTFTGFVLTFYLTIFGVAILAIECNLMRARVWFYFMNFALGKAIFYGFMTLLCFGSGAQVSWFDIMVGVIFGLICILFFFLHLWFKADEPAYVQKLIEDMNKRIEERQNKTISTKPAQATISAQNRV